MSAQTLLIVGNVVIWLGLGGYMLFLSARSGRLARRLDQLEVLGHDRHA